MPGAGIRGNGLWRWLRERVVVGESGCGREGLREVAVEEKG